MSWPLALLTTLKDTANHIISSDVAVVISDKYPKAKHHYLVLPKTEIPSIFALRRDDLPLLEELWLLAVNVIEVKQLCRDDFRIGFHAEPSMQQLHLHCISRDFVSECLKTKKHWNSFNTSLFLPYTVACERLKEQGSITRLSPEQVKSLAGSELKCNQCAHKAKNMPTLKEHLFEHWRRAAANERNT